MNCTDLKALVDHGVTIEDLYQGALLIKMKAEQLSKEGRDPEKLYESEYHIISALVEMGHTESMLLLAELLQGGKLPSMNEKEAVRKAFSLWEKAGQSGAPRGYTNIGLLYLHNPVPGGSNKFGDVEYDPRKALECFHKATELNDSKAPRHIGLCYRNGIGVEKDDEKAYEFFSLAAARNDSTGKYLKAECLYNGTGVRQDKDKALSIMRELVEKKAHDADKAALFLKTHN